MRGLRSILITGGTGSFGKMLTRVLLEEHPEVERIVVFSRDELKQSEMAVQPPFDSRKLRFFIGDVRDVARLRRALEGVDAVVHAAALKQVPAAEYNPFEAIRTNVLGAQNVIEACLDREVSRVVALSTDKATAPVNLYGATKLCSDKLFVAANNFKGSRDIRFAVVRYGNVMGSRGSVIPFFLKRRSSGVLPITDSRMTRFNVTLREGVELVLYALEATWGGEIFVPKCPSYKITDVATAIAPGCKQEIVGVRPGEKIHEELITVSDALMTVECERHFVIAPSTRRWDGAAYEREFSARKCPDGFRYGSDNNTNWLTVEQLRELIRTHIDPDFDPNGS